MGIIGIGNMGSTHAKNIADGKIPEMRLTAIADLKESRRGWAVQNLPSDVNIFTTGEELIKSHICDAVVIATPHYQHPTLAMQAFGEKLHVLSEKPSGVYTKQVREMNEAADHSDVTNKGFEMKNPAFAIFTAKNKFGETNHYTDEQTMVIEPRNPLDDMSDEAILKAAQSLPDDESDIPKK